MTRVIDSVSRVADLSLNSEPSVFPVPPPRLLRVCRACGCTDADCSVCIGLTGEPCSWVTLELCSACVSQAERRLRLYAKIGNRSVSAGPLYRAAMANWPGNLAAADAIGRAADVLRVARPNASW